MCLYPRFILNGKYKETKKNRGIIPPVSDFRTLYVPYGCGNCLECRQQKAREWMLRLTEDIKHNKNGVFVTLTFNNESIRKLTYWGETKRYQPIHLLEGYDLDNAIATRAMRLFNERWRKKYKKALRHWMTTELGHNGTQNIHLHGIIWCKEKERQEIADKWEYGYVWPRYDKDWKENYVTETTVNYITKYVYKVDEIHKTYKSIMLTSPGIGKAYTESAGFLMNKYNGIETKDTYTTSSGYEISMPIYWRNKRYSDNEREQLWLQKLDKQVRYVDGVEIDVSESLHKYFARLKIAREKNNELGYGSDQKNWSREVYEKQVRAIMHHTRLTGFNNEGERKQWMEKQWQGEWMEEAPF